MTSDAINAAFLVQERQGGLEQACLLVEHLTKEVDNWVSPMTTADPDELHRMKLIVRELFAILAVADIGSYNGAAHAKVTAKLTELDRHVQRLEERLHGHLSAEESMLTQRSARQAAWDLQVTLDELRFGSALVPPAYIDLVEEAEQADGDEAHAASSAATMVLLSALLLPAPHRARWAEEAWNELDELARAKATTGMQIYHALRYSARVFRLRSALKNPARHKWSWVHRLLCWTLASEVRTWVIIGSVTTAALLNVVEEQGWGSALLAVPAAWGFHRGARWLRQRLGITSKESDE